MENKEAQTKYQINELLKKRWSPRAFASKAVEIEKLQRIFEAARWTPSAFNEQPWRFIVGIKGKGNTWQKIFDTLVDGNKIWAENAPILILSISKCVYTRNNEENCTCEYDLGQAVALMSVQAMGEGVYTHQMAGFRKRKAIVSFDIPEVYTPKTIVAMGYLGDVNTLPDDLKASENAIRIRKNVNEFVFEESFGGNTSLFSDITEK